MVKKNPSYNQYPISFADRRSQIADRGGERRGGPIITLTLSLIIYIPIPYGIGVGISENKYSILYILAISSISVYVLLLTGWSSNSKYAFIGAIRSIAQLISYEVSIGIIIMSIIIINNSLNLMEIIRNQIYISNIFGVLPKKYPHTSPVASSRLYPPIHR